MNPHTKRMFLGTGCSVNRIQTMRGYHHLMRLTHSIKSLLLPALLFCAVFSTAQQQAHQEAAKQPVIPVSEIKPGMKGYALTVFSGIKPEQMGVEVLGVLQNANGPRGDLILVKLTGEHAEYTGVVAGMSGSPVYFDGRLAGALSYRIGVFSKEPIAGVTPIADMLEINEIDRTPAPKTSTRTSNLATENERTSSAGGGTLADA